MVLTESTTDEADLKALIYGGQCVAFVGAGISIPPGCEWDVLVDELATNCDVDANGGLSKAQVVDRCIDNGKERLNGALRTIFPRHIARLRPALPYLHRLPFKALLTTNFDPWVHQHSRREHYEKCFIYPDLPLSSTGISKALYYLHGYFDPEDNNFDVERLVFGARSFEEAYQRSLLPGFLLNTFTYENVLFVAFNPKEENIAALLRGSVEQRRRISSRGRQEAARRVRRFILWDVKEYSSSEERALAEAAIDGFRSLEVTPVLYDKKGDDFRGLEEVLLQWIEEGDLKERPSPFASGFDIEGEKDRR
ncbi:MAG: SIR2 family protein [Acidobacteriia bacterium]|nr:SIR2 family protein [Terriglobia bacterium]